MLETKVVQIKEFIKSQIKKIYANKRYEILVLKHVILSD